MVNNFGNSVIKLCCKKVGGVTTYLNMAVFSTFLKAYCCKSGLLGKVYKL